MQAVLIKLSELPWKEEWAWLKEEWVQSNKRESKQDKGWVLNVLCFHELWKQSDFLKLFIIYKVQ